MSQNIRCFCEESIHHGTLMPAEPRERIALWEATASLPSGLEERFNGYGVMGLPFSSGHI